MQILKQPAGLEPRKAGSQGWERLAIQTGAGFLCCLNLLKGPWEPSGDFPWLQE